MVIKSSDDYKIGVLYGFIVSICFFFYVWYAINNLWILFTFGLWPIITNVRLWIAEGRTLIMDEEGCIVKFLWFQKKYRWKELKTKSIENLEHRIGDRVPYKQAAVFSLKKRKCPSWIEPMYYCMLIHPFSYFFVYFVTDFKFKKWHTQSPFYYNVNEQEFMAKMAEWKVFEKGEKTGDGSQKTQGTVSVKPKKQ